MLTLHRCTDSLFWRAATRDGEKNEFAVHDGCMRIRHGRSRRSVFWQYAMWRLAPRIRKKELTCLWRTGYFLQWWRLHRLWRFQPAISQEESARLHRF